MGYKEIITLLFLLLGMTCAIQVKITEDWKPDLGWEVTCSWRISPEDALQSVSLTNNGQQFMIYRPQQHGPKRSEFFRTSQNLMKVDCIETVEKGLIGKCVLTIEPYQPPTSDFSYSCEVSGERPWFRVEKKELLIRAYVPPSDAVVSASLQREKPVRVLLNCSSSGLPAPNLVWTVGDQMVPADFTGRFWNATTKLWHVWSFLTSSPEDESLKVNCTPEVNSNGHLEKGQPAEYSLQDHVNAATRLFETTKVIATLFLLLELLR